VIHRAKLLESAVTILSKSNCISLIGPTGSGKTTIAVEISKRLKLEPVVVNCSGIKKINTILEEIGGNAINPFCCIILDACEDLGEKAVKISSKILTKVILTSTLFIRGCKTINIHSFSLTEATQIVREQFPNFNGDISKLYKGDIRKLINSIRFGTTHIDVKHQEITPMQLVYAIISKIPSLEQYVHNCRNLNHVMKIIAVNAEKIWQGDDLEHAFKLINTYNSIPYPSREFTTKILVSFKRSSLMPPALDEIPMEYVGSDEKKEVGPIIKKSNTKKEPPPKKKTKQSSLVIL